MKNLLAIAVLLITALAGCGKNEMGCTPVSPADEEPKIKAYANANGITATKHASGVYYQVIDSGMGVIPQSNSTVTATYTGKLLDGTTFDSGTAGFPLSGVIEGWQIGIPLIKKGGKIKLIIPSSYAYGCNGSPRGGIPSNAVLFFDIHLIDVK
jgi:FKBP-type peptidyl-prolyl cis-trans isomerase FkpA